MHISKAQRVLGLLETFVKENSDEEGDEGAEETEKGYFIKKYGKEKGMKMYLRHEQEERD